VINFVFADKMELMRRTVLQQQQHESVHAVAMLDMYTSDGGAVELRWFEGAHEEGQQQWLK